ncbi:hypothetical protein ABFA07_012569 [Porites harrisoni]
MLKGLESRPMCRQ